MKSAFAITILWFTGVHAHASVICKEFTDDFSQTATFDSTVPVLTSTFEFKQHSNGPQTTTYFANDQVCGVALDPKTDCTAALKIKDGVSHWDIACGKKTSASIIQWEDTLEVSCVVNGQDTTGNIFFGCKSE